LRGRIALGIMLTLGVVLLAYSLYIGVMIGADWFGVDASFPWHMNNYIVMEGKYAYSIFGLATLALGGFAAGLAMSSFFTFAKNRKHMLILIVAFFVAIIMTGLGFNTLDFMLGGFYWTNMQYPPPVWVPFFGSVDVWNFYFFFFVAPLWAGGFIMGLAASYYGFVYRVNLFRAALTVEKDMSLLNQAIKAEPIKEYVAE
jgi:hypothetical protein